MDAFATIDDLTARWRELTEDEEARATEELLDATALITALLNKYRVTIDADDEVQARNLMVVTCSVVRRAMSADQTTSGAGAFPLSSVTETAGVFSATYSYANSLGDKFLTNAEKRLLGIGRMRVGQMFAYVPTEEDEDGDT